MLTGALTALATGKGKTSDRPDVYTLPGATVYPEGVALHRRSGATIGELELWLDLTGTALAYAEGFNANGIVSLARGRLLVVNAQFDKRPTGNPALPLTVSAVTLRGGS